VELCRQFLAGLRHAHDVTLMLEMFIDLGRPVYDNVQLEAETLTGLLVCDAARPLSVSTFSLKLSELISIMFILTNAFLKSYRNPFGRVLLLCIFPVMLVVDAVVLSSILLKVCRCFAEGLC